MPLFQDRILLCCIVGYIPIYNHIIVFPSCSHHFCWWWLRSTPWNQSTAWLHGPRERGLERQTLGTATTQLGGSWAAISTLIENECHTEILATYYFFLIVYLKHSPMLSCNIPPFEPGQIVIKYFFLIYILYIISCLKHSPMLSCNIPPFEPGQIVIGNGWKQLTNIHGLSWEHSRN